MTSPREAPAGTGDLEYDLEGLADVLGDHYADLGLLAEALYDATRPKDDRPLGDFLAELDRRMPLDTVRGYLLAARHELHGALTTIVKTRGRLPRREV